MKNYAPVILICGSVLAISMGIRQSFGLYLTPISADLSLDREVFALSMALMNLVWGLGAPIAGAFTDKFGPKFVICFGAITYAIGLYVLASATQTSSIITAGAIMGVGISGTGFTAVLGAAGRAVPSEKRSLTLGLVSMGGSIGQFAALPFTHQLLKTFGWSASLLILCAIAGTVTALGLSTSSMSSKTTASEQSTNWVTTLNQAVTQRDFLLLTTGFCVCGFHVAFVATHLPAFLEDNGYPATTGMAALTLIGLGNIFGTYFFGWVGQHVPQRLALSALYAARSAVFVPFLMLPLSDPIIWLFSLMLGFLWLGTIPLTSGLVATLFGAKWMSMLFGLVFLSHQIGAFMGAWLGGRIYDRLGSYEAMWWVSIFLGLIATLLHWPIKESPIQSPQTNPSAP